jgi:hypothetical protein
MSVPVIAILLVTHLVAGLLCLPLLPALGGQHGVAAFRPQRTSLIWEYTLSDLG